MHNVVIVQGWILQKRMMAFSVRIGCVKLVRHCGKLYSRHFLVRSIHESVQVPDARTLTTNHGAQTQVRGDWVGRTEFPL